MDGSSESFASFAWPSCDWLSGPGGGSPFTTWKTEKVSGGRTVRRGPPFLLSMAALLLCKQRALGGAEGTYTVAGYTRDFWYFVQAWDARWPQSEDSGSHKSQLHSQVCGGEGG